MICPFCRKANQCEVNSNDSCWCFELEIPPEMLALLENNEQGKSCICASCIELYKEDEQSFIQCFRQ